VQIPGVRHGVAKRAACVNAPTAFLIIMSAARRTPSYLDYGRSDPALARRYLTWRNRTVPRDERPVLCR
jgi:hypothetical protein